MAGTSLYRIQRHEGELLRECLWLGFESGSGLGLQGEGWGLGLGVRVRVRVAVRVGGMWPGSATSIWLPG